MTDPAATASPPAASARSGRRTALGAEAAALLGMSIAVTAREAPTRLAIASRHGDRSFDALNAQANQLVRALRARGIGAGDGVALLCSNRAEFVVAFYACLRCGLRLTPINTELTIGEIRYIVEDCEAKVLIADGRHAEAAAEAARTLPQVRERIGIGDPVHGFAQWEDVLEAESPDDIDDPVLGSQMLYTSGTTGRPKGVYREPTGALRQPGLAAAIASLDYRPGLDSHLCTGPLHHAAPLVFSLAMPLGLGCSVVLMDGWDAQYALELIDAYRITHTHMVPVMFRRLLELPSFERGARDVSSIRVVIHGAAPCPVDVKKRMIEWLGPVVYEYYAATEGWGCYVDSEEWLSCEGTVGRPAVGDVEVRDQEGKVLPPGREGVIFLRAPSGGRFEYFKDEPKTRASYSGDYFTLGDVGWLDPDGFLYLRDRSADVINTGGMNVYPAEIDAVLVAHEAVADAATVGVSNDEWGEEALSVIELAEGHIASTELEAELHALCAEHLASFKCPKRFVFEEGLPRLENGKIYRRLVRERYRAQT